jgi:hypothetical protein
MTYLRLRRVCCWVPVDVAVCFMFPVDQVWRASRSTQAMWVWVVSLPPVPFDCRNVRRSAWHHCCSHLCDANCVCICVCCICVFASLSCRAEESTTNAVTSEVLSVVAGLRPRSLLHHDKDNVPHVMSTPALHQLVSSSRTGGSSARMHELATGNSSSDLMSPLQDPSDDLGMDISASADAVNVSDVNVRTVRDDDHHRHHHIRHDLSDEVWRVPGRSHGFSLMLLPLPVSCICLFD